MPTVYASMAAAALAGALALASGVGDGRWALAGGLAVVQVVFAYGVIRATSQQAVRVVAGLAVGAGIGALVWTALDETAELAPVASVLGPTLVVAIIAQLSRRHGRPALNVSLALSVAACALILMLVLWLALHEANRGVHSVGLGLLGVGVVCLAETAPRRFRAARRVVGVVIAAVGAGAVVMLVGNMDNDVPPVSGVVVAAFAGLMAAVAFAVVDRLAGDVPSESEPVAVPVPHRTPHDQGGQSGEMPDAMMAAADETVDNVLAPSAYSAAPHVRAAVFPLRIALPFISAAPVVYVLGRVFVS